MDDERRSIQNQPDITALKEKPSAPPTQGPTPVGKILLVEDDLPMVRMYSTKLKKENFEVEVACDGEEGLKKTREWQPDLVVLDLMIPKMGGMGLLEQLRLDPKTKNVPVIILSNLSQEQDIARSRQLGVKEFLIKANFTPSQVVEKIKGYLRS